MTKSKIVIILILLISSLVIRGENSYEPIENRTQNDSSRDFVHQNKGFVENKGQLLDVNYKPNRNVLFLLNTCGMNVQLRKRGFSYDLYGVEPKEDRASNQEEPININTQESRVHFHRIDIEFVGSNPDYEIITSSPFSDFLNYYTTGNPFEGIRFVRSYSQVIYKNIFSQIDLVFLLDEENEFKYNFIIHPGGRIEDIQLRISDPDITLCDNGSLLLQNSVGVLEESIPNSYEINEGMKIPIVVKFHKIQEDRYGFLTENFIPRESTLIIDPTPRRIWATYYGGSQNEIGGNCVIDHMGFLYFAGYTNSIDNIATNGAYQSTLEGDYDAFLVKFTPDGQRIWGTYYGGGNEESLYGCAIDSSNNIYISGRTLSTTNISTPGSHQQNLGGAIDCFLAKFSENGQLTWATYYGGSGPEYFANCNVDGFNNVYLAGETSSPTNISTPGSHQSTPGGSDDAFLVKFDSSGTRLWGTYYGGSNMDWGFGCCIGKDGDIFLTGSAASTNNISTPGSHQPVFAGMQDAFLVKFNSSGVRLWGTYYGGNLADDAHGSVIDTNGNIYMAGHTMSVDNISSPGSHQFVYGGGGDAFLVKFDAAGIRSWGTYYGGNQSEQCDARSVSIDYNEQIYLYGATQSNTNISNLNSYQPNYAGNGDAFLAKFRVNGQRIWGTYYGDTATDYGTACAIDHCGHQYFLGGTESLYNISTVGSHQYQFGGGDVDVILVKFADCTPPDSAGQIIGNDTACVNTTVNIYFVPEIPFATGYSWSVPLGCTIISGQNTETIYVTFGPGAISGSIGVYGTSCCGDGVPSYFYVSVLPRPIPTISGPDTSCTGIPSVYFTEPNKVSYQWIIPTGGSIISGGGISDSTITILWTTTGSNWIQVNYTDSSGCNALTPSLKNVWIESGDTVGITIYCSTDTICSGTLVTFTAIPVNGGTTPNYQWQVNGVNTGMNSPVYTYLPFTNDHIQCILTSSDSVCISNNPDTSNVITMTVNPNLPVSISVSPSANPFCLGTSVTFTATPVNGGVSPTYQWMVNWINVGTNNPIFTYIPASLDLVSCILTSSLPDCLTNNPDTSAGITMIGFPGLPADVTVSAVPSPSCSGIPVTFTATPINGGSNPSFQWQVNGLNVGTNSPVYSYIPSPNDSIRCIMTSNLVCVSNNPVFSPQSPVFISPTPAVTFTPCFDTITTTNAKPIKLKGGIPLGGTYSGPGVSGGYFYPNLAGVGAHVITYTYVNAALCSSSTSSRIHEFTNPVFYCGNNWIDIRDGKSYPTIQIGGQCWFAADLDYGIQIAETLHQRDNCIAEKYSRTTSYVPRPSYYQWDELMRYDPTPASQGLCPPNWHIPTEVEWATLFANWTNNAFAANPLKYSGYSGFNAFLSGARHETVQWDYQNFATFFWSSTAYGPYKAWAHGMNDPDPSVSYYPSLRSNAFSVRCLKD